MEPGSGISLKVTLPEQGTLPPPEGANYFAVSRVGTTVQLTVGYVDLLLTATRAGEIRQGKDSETPVPVQVRHRLLMGMEAFLQLHAKVNEIAAIIQGDMAEPANKGVA